MEPVDKTAVIELLKSGMIDADNTLVCDAYECNSMLEWAIEEVQKMKPSAIIRCRDCVHHNDEEPGMVFCPSTIGSWVPENWFCADGERREDGTGTVQHGDPVV